MSEQQLTVAELMARAAKEGGRSSESGRRRRRRSLEDGGVSVAELTGSIPKVKAKPEEARHTAVPIDAPEPESDPQPQAASTSTPAKAPQDSSKQSENKVTTKVPGDVPISVVDKEDPVRLTTDSFPAQKPKTPAASASPAAPAARAPRVDAVAPVTTPVARIPEGQAPSGPSAAPAQASKPVENEKAAGAAKPEVGTARKIAHSGQDIKDTAIIPVVPETSAMAPAPAAAVAAAPASDAPKAEVPATASDSELARDDEQIVDEDGKVSVLSIVVMAIIGLVLGIGIFFGFKVLWANVQHLLVAVLAVAMTLGIVGVVHALRTEKDGMSMFLAAIAGVAVTFGPLLIAGL